MSKESVRAKGNLLFSSTTKQTNCVARPVAPTPLFFAGTAALLPLPMLYSYRWVYIESPFFKKRVSVECQTTMLISMCSRIYTIHTLLGPRSKTRRHKKNRSAGKHSGTSPLLRQVLRRSLLGHIGK